MGPVGLGRKGAEPVPAGALRQCPEGPDGYSLQFRLILIKVSSLDSSLIPSFLLSELGNLLSIHIYLIFSFSCLKNLKISLYYMWNSFFINSFPNHNLS